MQLQQRRCPADVRHFGRNCCNRMRIYEFIYKLWASTCLPEGGGIILGSGGGTLQKLCKNACKPTADCFYEWSCTESYINTEPDLASWTYHDTFCECPKRLMMPWLHMFRCMLVVHHKSLISRAVLNQAIVEGKCLIQDPSLDSFFKIQYKTKLNISVVFILPVALGVAVLLPPLLPLLLCS